MDKESRDLIYQLIDQTISEQDFDKLQNAIEVDGEVRDEYLRIVGLCETISDLSLNNETDSTFEINDKANLSNVPTNPINRRTTNPLSYTGFGWMASTVAAILLVVACFTAYLIGSWNRGETVVRNDPGFQAESEEESQIAGHATLRSAVDVRWSDDSAHRRQSELLPNGLLAFDQGVVEIDFFCGATLVVEGPARLDIESDWAVKVIRGRLRATVPPAARGFTVKAADSEIIDLGTEFALEINENSARVEVIDGEVELRGGEYDGTRLVTGEGRSLKGLQNQVGFSEGLISSTDILRDRSAAESTRFKEWLATSKTLANDNRLIAYYPIVELTSERVVPNASQDKKLEFDGQIVGPVNKVFGRFGFQSSGLEFGRPGARVRTRIDGEFSAFTFSCWVRIDSLDHRYNALFMADSYQTGEPHWQIRDDGSLMFSVMVDDSQTIRHFSKIEKRMVNHAGLHRVYYTKPFWDISQSGQWFHLAAVYDPKGRKVEQYVNGQMISNHEIIDKFHIESLKIGASEIGNWGQPFRKSPWFAVRNLNGTIDELAIFDAALKSSEIDNLYQQGKPLGY